MGYTKGTCVCGNKQESKGRLNGRQYFGTFCTKCRKNQTRLKFLVTQDLKCNHCGFEAVHRSQMDVDHIDGNHQNNDHSNLQVLCANCHRLKTYVNEDWKIKK